MNVGVDITIDRSVSSGTNLCPKNRVRFRSNCPTTGAACGLEAPPAPGVSGVISWGPGNIDQFPGFLEVQTGTWSSCSHNSATGQTTLVDQDGSWTVNSLVGKWLRPDASDATKIWQYQIVSNTSNAIVISADVTDFVASTDMYAIYDYHLQNSTSPCVDTGMPHLTNIHDYLDVNGNSVYNAGTDIIINLNGYTPGSSDVLLTTDLDGVAFDRLRDGNGDGTMRIDMGAYEY